MSLKINDDPHKNFDKHEYEGIHYCAKQDFYLDTPRENGHPRSDN